jgi:hypothetical protein
MLRPIVLECGHSFCDTCARTIADGPPTGRKCPSCRREIRCSDLPVNISLKILLLSLLAKCTNEGCDWSGKVGEYETHSTLCEFKSINCEFKERGCAVSFLKNEKETHKTMCQFRSVTCDKCKSDVCLKFMTTHEKSKCPMRMVFCPFFNNTQNRHLIRM